MRTCHGAWAVFRTSKRVRVADGSPPTAPHSGRVWGCPTFASGTAPQRRHTMTLDARLARLERVTRPAPQQNNTPRWSAEDGRKFEEAMAEVTARLTPVELEEWAAWYTCHNTKES